MTAPSSQPERMRNRLIPTAFGSSSVWVSAIAERAVSQGDGTKIGSVVSDSSHQHTTKVETDAR